MAAEGVAWGKTSWRRWAVWLLKVRLNLSGPVTPATLAWRNHTGSFRHFRQWWLLPTGAGSGSYRIPPSTALGLAASAIHAKSKTGDPPGRNQSIQALVSGIACFSNDFPSSSAAGDDLVPAPDVLDEIMESWPQSSEMVWCGLGRLWKAAYMLLLYSGASSGIRGSVTSAQSSSG